MKQIGLPLHSRHHQFCQSLVWLQTKLDSTQSTTIINSLWDCSPAFKYKNSMGNMAKSKLSFFIACNSCDWLKILKSRQNRCLIHHSSHPQYQRLKILWGKAQCRRTIVLSFLQGPLLNKNWVTASLVIKYFCDQKLGVLMSQGTRWKSYFHQFLRSTLIDIIHTKKLNCKEPFFLSYRKANVACPAAFYLSFEFIIR